MEPVPPKRKHTNHEKTVNPIVKHPQVIMFMAGISGSPKFGMFIMVTSLADSSFCRTEPDIW
jgi:glutaredoxin-related protein